ncbi:spore germination protein [Paenibacillus sp. LMG 31458]|uniref:Spore germination protein n=2 Tax=Paenibacillus TaxID=44249 RepID=A0ABX1Z5X1_9BACL|nr:MULTISPECIES: spore germination protein [Paenibacillus]NOU70826.1 spore germination protein [Paenibacillus phytorum]NOU88638.1 spore germination protein [Paenibacillus germinis]
MDFIKKILKNNYNNSTDAQINQNGFSISKELLEESLDLNFDKLKKAFGNSSDLITQTIHLNDVDSIQIGVIYMNGLVNPFAIQSLLTENLKVDSCEFPLDALRSSVSTLGQVREIPDFETLYQSILSGLTVILLDGCVQGLAANTQGGEHRSVEEPTTQSVVRGPREGFTELISTNAALIRRKIKDSNLWMESMTIGRVSKTDVAIMYMNGIVNDKLVAEARIRLGRIDIDAIFESANIEELIQDETYTPFPTLYNTERPDVIAAGLMEGRIAILVDGTPFVLMAPALFTQFYQSAEDYYQRADFATLLRLLRYVCFFISLLAPSLYIAITTFHQELLPSSLLISLAAQREGIPFPAFIEAVVMEITFEILREAGVRLPKTVGQAVSIVGALVIGQAAVEAGLVSPAMVIIVAITAISNFVIPSFNMGITIRILRFLLMLIAASFGLYGVTVGLIAIVLHLCSLRSFGIPYMSPMAPFIVADQKDTIFRLPQWALHERPRLISQKNNIRENNASSNKPEPRP